MSSRPWHWEPTLWRWVARTFRRDPAVVFDLYNEPYPDNNQDTTAAWSCLLNGCTQSFYVDGNGANVKFSWQAAGMNQLVSAIRATGATNLIISPGVGWAGLMTHWLEYAPSDPQQNLAPTTHIYPNTWCSTPSCWDSVLAPIASQYPLVVGEMGESDCAHAFVDSLMTWLDQHTGNYLAWHWWPISDVPCANFPLITDYTSGGATAYGVGLKDHLAALAAAPAPTSAPTSAPVGADVACSVLGSIDVAPAIGGTLTSSDGRLSVAVPAGAVTEWTTVRLSLVQQPDSLPVAGRSLQVGGDSYRVSAVNTSGQTITSLNGPIAISASMPEIAVVDPASGAPLGQADSVDPNGSVSVQLAMLPLAASACP